MLNTVLFTLLLMTFDKIDVEKFLIIHSFNSSFSPLLRTKWIYLPSEIKSWPSFIQKNLFGTRILTWLVQCSAVVVLKNGRNPWTVYEMLHERFYPYEWSMTNWHTCCWVVVVEHLQNHIGRVDEDDKGRELYLLVKNRLGNLALLACFILSVCIAILP